MRAEPLQPLLEDRVVHIVLVERLAFRVDERGPGWRLKVHELRQMPEVELHEELRWPRGDLLRRHDAPLQPRLQVFLPGIDLPEESVVQEEVVLPRDVGHVDVGVLLQRQEEMSGLRVHNEPTSDRFRALKELPDTAPTASREWDQGEVVLEGCQETIRPVLHWGLGKAPPR